MNKIMFFKCSINKGQLVLINRNDDGKIIIADKASNIGDIKTGFYRVINMKELPKCIIATVENAKLFLPHNYEDIDYKPVLNKDEALVQICFFEAEDYKENDLVVCKYIIKKEGEYGESIYYDTLVYDNNKWNVVKRRKMYRPELYLSNVPFKTLEDLMYILVVWNYIRNTRLVYYSKEEIDVSSLNPRLISWNQYTVQYTIFRYKLEEELENYNKYTHGYRETTIIDWDKKREENKKC